MMKTLNKALAALVLSAWGASAFAAQACDEQTLHALGAFLKLDRFGAGAEGRILASTCKVLPNDPHTTAAAMIFHGELREVENDDERLLVSLIDNRSFNVIAAHDERFSSGMAVDYPKYALNVDTARYNLSDDVFVFGIDIVDNHAERRACNWDGADGPTLTLFAYDKKKSLRPILSMPRSQWIYRTCLNNTLDQFKILVEESRTTLAVGKAKTHGYADLLVNVSSSLSLNGEPFKRNPKRKPLRSLIRYDGQQYDIKPYELAKEKWFNR
ncbi:hypothetical protein [Massilia sp. CCM 8734]|uniref:hypothetical protein n=1 Tax=Massilia sp. CCM 8734 TaxID=2609283 RepID=UPI00141F44E1|nr:hypothetical protein [Massilia sp. CCM 8734]NHZ94377.1 hypothetical protein [Massilia sp. CCM 8734]